MKKRPFVLFLLILLVFGGIGYFLTISDLLSRGVIYFRAYLERSGAGALIFILLATVSSMLSFFSSVPLAPLATVLWGPFVTAILLLIGWTLGGTFAYVVGKRFGYPIVRMFLPTKKIQQWSHQVGCHINFVLVLVFRLVTPSETGYIFGILRYPFLKYVLATFLSEVPYAFAMAYGSDALLSQEGTLFFALVLVSVLFLLGMYAIYRKKFLHVHRPKE